MAKSDDPEEQSQVQTPASDARGRKRPKAAPDAAFDVWLHRGLHAMFDEVAKEPIPDELIRLIEADRRK